MKKIAVISDPQIDLKNIENEIDIEVLQKCFNNMNVDAVAVCGDITENALQKEMDCFFNTYKRYCPAKNLYVVPGNMDNVYVLDGQNTYLEAYKRFNNIKFETLYFSHEADNYIMIGISPEPVDDGIITDKQLDFIDNAVKRAAELGIPAIIISHYQLTDTININWEYASLGSDSLKVKPILERYNGSIIFFSGHTHRGLIIEKGGSVITKNNVTYVSVPSISKPDIEHYNADNNNKGTGYIIEIDKKRIKIKGFDFLNNKYLESFDWII